MKISLRTLAATIFVFVLTSCTSLYPTIENPIEWWAVNGWNSRVTMELYDVNCSRFLGKVRFNIDEERKMVSCGDSNGQAKIRYRREGYSSRQPPWSPDSMISHNQAIVVR